MTLLVFHFFTVSETLTEMWYGVFLWALVSSLFFHIPGTAGSLHPPPSQIRKVHVGGHPADGHRGADLYRDINK
ncbi:unnamed protein product [Ranitomeya imitator]|uniref:Uncharacterized protein n=1 Tax=Ranitomeya imitator TaxID=111125 RepID=A0ABN9LLM9_9NEOB|nr:unnamed protein product [Ranitomeya imitator]